MTNVHRSLLDDFNGHYDTARARISVEEGSSVRIRRDAHHDMYADKTKSVHKIDNDYVDTTNGGGFTQQSLLRYIDAVVVPHTKNKRCLLLVDAASICHSAITYAKARRHNIELLQIPANCTQWLQPNDVSVFGPAKKKLRTRDDTYLSEGGKPDLRRAITAMSMCIDEMKDSVAPSFTYVCESPPDVLRRNKIQTKSSSTLPVRAASAPF